MSPAPDPRHQEVDADRRQVEVQRAGDAGDRPTVVADRFVWRPVADGPALEIDVASLLPKRD